MNPVGARDDEGTDGLETRPSVWCRLPYEQVAESIRTDCTRSRGAFASADAELPCDEPDEADPDAPAPLPVEPDAVEPLPAEPLDPAAVEPDDPEPLAALPADPLPAIASSVPVISTC
jgi:hypothetical protein